MFSAKKTIRPDWFKNPEKKHVVVVTVIFLFATLLQVLAATDLFTENPFQLKYLLTWLLTLSAFGSTLQLWRNYFATKTPENKPLNA